MRRNPIADAVTADLDRLGIRWTTGMGGKHACIEFRWRGRDMAFSVACTPRRNGSSVENTLTRLRRVLGVRREIHKAADRRERDVCRAERETMPPITPGGDGLAALAGHPMARKPRGYLGRFWFGDEGNAA